MKCLHTQLSGLGLSRPQIENSLLTIEEWLDEQYPVLARLYHTEVLKKAGLFAYEEKSGTNFSSEQPSLMHQSSQAA